MATSDVGSDKGPGPGVVAQSRGRPARCRGRALKSTSTFQTIQLQGSVVNAPRRYPEKSFFFLDSESVKLCSK